MNKYIREERLSLSLLTLFTVLSSLLTIAVQFSKGELLNVAISNDYTALWQTALLLLLFIGLEIGTYYMYDHFRSIFAEGIRKRVRKDYFSSLLNKSLLEHTNENKGTYMAQFTNQINLICRDYYGTIPILIQTSVKVVFLSVSLIVLDVRIALVAFALLTLPVIFPKLIEKRLKQTREKEVIAIEKQVKALTDWINGFHLIKTFSIESIVNRKFDALNDEVRNQSFEMRRITYINRAITSTISYVSFFIIMFFAAYLVVEGTFSPGQFFIAITLVGQLQFPTTLLATYIQSILASKTVLSKMEAFIFSENTSSKSHSIKQPISEIVYNNVSFGYDENHILNNFSLHIKNREKCIITGPSGSGKSTLMKLLVGDYAPDKGSVKFDNTNTSQIDNLYDYVAVMNQEAYLFNDTLRNNLTMYDEKSDEDLFNMLHSLNLSKFANVEALNEVIKENGDNYSGGEKKRIALARTLLRQTPVVILDEPLANVDKETIQSIENYITEIDDRMVFVISHHFDHSKLNNFQHIVTME